DAHPSAPAPVSALLSGVLIKVLGVFALVRVIFTLFHRADVFLDLLALLGILSILLGAVLALAQWDYKRLLAYSSISQVGYIILGIGIGTPLGVMGALLHMLNHGVFKSLLFLNAGAVEYRLGTRDIREMGGLENRMPLTSTSAIFGFLSLAGVPPLNGFWSKLFIILAAIQVGANGYAVIAALASVITLGYALKVMKQAFFGELNTKWENVREIPWTMGGALVFLSILCVVMGLGIGVLLDELVIPAVDMLFL
ncbi:MAG TPA: proton-conducting transporter membrane subunit, partial [bacterium]|nr:proton-conducting transporter membrane subunit [bacterium]